MDKELAENKKIHEQRETTGEKRGEFVVFLKELPVLIITAVILAWLIKSFVVQPFYIPSGSMEPTLYPGDRVLVNKFLYDFREPSKTDVIVFLPPGSDDKDYIKRIVATEGEEIEVKNGQVYVNGKTKSESYIINQYNASNYGPKRIPSENVFVMGDNRPNSRDGREFGPLPTKRIVGKAFMIYWPPQRIQLLN
jgi:signal peptidase I